MFKLRKRSCHFYFEICFVDCHYEFKDLINSTYIDDINGSRCFKRCKKIFLYELEDLINNIYINDVNGFRHCM